MKQGNRKSPFPQQTHFIGVLAPDDITLTLEDCRRYMNETYGCKSGHATPIHVTLVPPFLLSQEYTTEDITQAIECDVLPQNLGFTAQVDNFDAFGDRTLFAKVTADARWTALRDAVFSSVYKAAPGCIQKDKRPFTPHLTVSNRDIPAGVTKDALKVMNEMNLVEEFPVDNITIFERRKDVWIPAASIELPQKL
ncbi:MAG: 2'-5' RNA ligase family protein [Treponema sp.]|nr:2'-5' RNA ligase family protein [Treponema sp.]